MMRGQNKGRPSNPVLTKAEGQTGVSVSRLADSGLAVAQVDVSPHRFLDEITRDDVHLADWPSEVDVIWVVLEKGATVTSDAARGIASRLFDCCRRRWVLVNGDADLKATIVRHLVEYERAGA